MPYKISQTKEATKNLKYVVPWQPHQPNIEKGLSQCECKLGLHLMGFIS